MSAKTHWWWGWDYIQTLHLLSLLPCWCRLHRYRVLSVQHAILFRFQELWRKHSSRFDYYWHWMSWLRLRTSLRRLGTQILFMGYYPRRTVMNEFGESNQGLDSFVSHFFNLWISVVGLLLSKQGEHGTNMLDAASSEPTIILADPISLQYGATVIWAIAIITSLRRFRNSNCGEWHRCQTPSSPALLSHSWNNWNEGRA